MEIAIAMGVTDEILGHAAATPEVEVCGLLLGEGAMISAALPARNVHPDPARHFEVDPQILFSALRSSRAGGPQVIGHYHSHPSGPCAPSARDAADAAPGMVWLIVADGRIGLWQATEDGFVPVDIVNN